MTQFNKLNSNTTTTTPHYIFKTYFNDDGSEKSTFELNPPYQRNVVWDEKHYLKFIESIFMGVMPSPIIFAHDTKLNKKTCLDGKQRLTSIKKFFLNEIPYFVVVKNKIILYWYSSIQQNELVQKTIKKILEDIYQINVFENAITTNEMKSWIENELQLTIVQYINITYQQQIDIFNRIQYGISISRGSYLKSFIQDEKLCELVMETASKYKKYFGNYVSNANNEEHIKYMIEMFFILKKNISHIKNETLEYELKNMTLNEFKKMDEDYDNVIKKIFGTELLNAYRFKQKRVVIYFLLWGLKSTCDGTFHLDRAKNILCKFQNELDENENKLSPDKIKEIIEECSKAKLIKKIISTQKVKKNKSTTQNKNPKTIISVQETDSDDEYDDA